jgi:basic membrane protein A
VKKSRLRIIGVIALMAITAAACGKSSSSSKSSSTTGGSAGAATPFDRQPKVRIMTISPTNVGTWDPQQRLTYDKVSKEQGWDMQIAEAVPYGQAEQVLGKWGQEKVDVAFALDSGFGEAVLKVAPKYPKTTFVVMSALAPSSLPNVAAYSPDYCQMGYMAGAIGALSSSAGKVGVVSGLPVPAVKQFFNGAKQGAEAGKAGTEINLAYSGDWVDAVKKAETAAGLISKGADVIFSFDTVPTATDQRIQQAGKKLIGIFADESKFAPKAAITSVVINWQGYAETVDQVMKGTFKPGTHVRGFKEKMLDVLPVAGDSQLNSKISSMKAELASGSVKISGDCG